MGIFKPDKNGIICIPSLGNSDIEKLTDDLMKKLGYVRYGDNGKPLITPIIKWNHK